MLYEKISSVDHELCKELYEKLDVATYRDYLTAMFAIDMQKEDDFTSWVLATQYRKKAGLLEQTDEADEDGTSSDQSAE